MVFAWKSFVSEGVVIANDINDAANKLKARQGINAQDFLLSEMFGEDDDTYVFNEVLTMSCFTVEGKTKVWKYCVRFESGFPEDVVDYTLVRFTQPVPDERGMKFMKERYQSLSDYDDEDEGVVEGWGFA